ncbi:MAG: hypothetical protein E7257_10505 [Lachnospiraceae bacterium]|nr:hypothetical protein [Lachnospiraceae bacterium]
MDKGRTEQIIEKLIDSIENGQSVPFGAGKVAVNRDETIMMLRELESIVNGELKMYREFNDRKGKIINDAKKEAEEIIYEAEQTASRIRVTKRMSTIGTAFKAESLDKEEKQALRTAHDIYAASLIYTDEMLTEVNDVVAQAYDLVANQYGIMINTLQEKAELIAKNKAELMGSLKELSKEDRYTQILELGQLLSYELYNERMKARAMEEDGSYQMEMMFEEQAVATQQNQMQHTQELPVINEEPVVDSAFASVQNESVMDSAFASVQNEQVVDSAFAAVSEESIVDSAFESVPQEPVVDSAFEAVQQETVVDSAFANVQPETPAAPVQQVASVQPSQPEAVQANVQPQQAKHIPDEEHSIEAVSKTLEMFKNYRPGGNK